MGKLYSPSELVSRKVYPYHSWPGNIRELRNFCERMSILHSGQNIGVDDLPQEICQEGWSLEVRAQGPLVLPNEGLDFLQMERDLIDQALQRSQGNKSRAARLLGFTRDTFLYRLKKFSIPI